MEENKYLNAFNQIPQIGSVRFHKLIKHFPTLKEAWHAPARALEHAGIEQNIAEIIQSMRLQINPDLEMEKLISDNTEIVNTKDADYPAALKEIYNPPAILYLRGARSALNRGHAIAIVGTRKISPYGKLTTPHIVRDLSRAGINIISGLALGVDAIAHQTALEEKGCTVAVLGSGIDDRSIYPSANRTIAQRIIASGGAVISEFPHGALPLKMHFPYRNRIIAGLSLGAVVIEADLESGALITAKSALEFNRQVFAVPGSIFNRVSAGPNNLLKMGAKPVTSAADILEELNLGNALAQIQAKEIFPDNPIEAKILNLLSKEPIHVDRIIKESELAPAEVSSAITMMEIKGKIKNLGAMQYVKAR